VNHSHGSNDKWEQEVECKESGKGGVVYGEATSNSLNECAAYIGDGREQVCDDCSTSEGHLSSRENIANKGGHHD